MSKLVCAVAFVALLHCSLARTFLQRKAEACAPKTGYWMVGCYADRIVDAYNECRMMNTKKYCDVNANLRTQYTGYDKMTPARCWEFCKTVKGANHFALSQGTKCFCEPYYHKSHGAGGLGDCTAPCSGDSSKFCGGLEKDAIYEMHTCVEEGKSDGEEKKEEKKEAPTQAPTEAPTEAPTQKPFSKRAAQEAGHFDDKKPTEGSLRVTPAPGTCQSIQTESECREAGCLYAQVSRQEGYCEDWAEFGECQASDSIKCTADNRFASCSDYKKYLQQEHNVRSSCKE